MAHVLTNHADYIQRYGAYRWFLRECIRANPLYVISAALLSYGVLQLNVEIDPQIGKQGGVLASLALLHIYELAILIVATIVLNRRTGGGRDLHGLMIVAALFLSGSFLALDEQIAIHPRLGMAMTLLAFAFAATKLCLYARLPGVSLPRQYRVCILAMIAGHCVSPLLADPQWTFDYGKPALQGIGWLLGWLSTVPLVWLIWTERVRPLFSTPTALADPLETRWCGIWALVVTFGTSLFHLIATDWVFDRPAQTALLYPVLCILATVIVLLRWQRAPKLDFWSTSLLLAQVYLLQSLWIERASADAHWTWEMPFSAALQCWAACVVGYVALARVTGVREFYFGLLSPALAPTWAWLCHSRGRIPFFRALVSSALGFFFLLTGMLVSLYRERLLRWIDPARPVAVAGGAMDVGVNLDVMGTVPGSSDESI